MNAYIQKNKYYEIPDHFDCAAAMYGAIETCMDIFLISYNDLVNGKYDNLLKHHLFVGSVEFMTEVFRRLGKTPKLPSNSNRKSVIETLEHALLLNETTGHNKIFIKPVQQKLFTGFVMEGFSYPDVEKLPLDTKVMLYNAFTSPIVSEYRLYIRNHACVDIRHYSGEIDVFPYPDYYKFVIAENKATFPNNYAMDIGILENGDNVVIEFNDMYAIGNYGIPNDLYIEMLKDRYFEIIK